MTQRFERNSTSLRCRMIIRNCRPHSLMVQCNWRDVIIACNIIWWNTIRERGCATPLIIRICDRHSIGKIWKYYLTHVYIASKSMSRPLRTVFVSPKTISNMRRARFVQSVRFCCVPEHFIRRNYWNCRASDQVPNCDAIKYQSCTIHRWSVPICTITWICRCT